MKSKAVIPLAIGLVAGVFAIKYTMDAVATAKGASESEEVAVLVAAVDIRSTVQITPDMLKVKKTPKTPLLPPDSFTKRDQLVGRVALKFIAQGAPILPSMIAPKGTTPGLLTRVKEGYRAVAVDTDESSGVAYLVRPGDWVDVLVVMNVKKGRQSETISRVILQNVEVGAVGQVLGEAGAEGGKPAKTITLLVKEDEVPRLHLAQSRGKITLAMRGNADTEITDPAQAKESEVLLGQKPVGQDQGDQKENALSKWFMALMTTPADQTPSQPQMAQRATRPEPEPTPEPATFDVVVIQGSAKDKSGGQVQRITYKDNSSMEVVKVSDDPVADQDQQGKSRNNRNDRSATRANRATKRGNSPSESQPDTVEQEQERNSTQETE